MLATFIISCLYLSRRPAPSSVLYMSCSVWPFLFTAVEPNELEEDLFLELAIAAHKKDMTFNDFIVYLIDEHMTEMLNNK